MPAIAIKRVYEKPEKSDGKRVLVDRIWPRGVSKEDAKLDDWVKDIAPTTDLRKWFDHKPERYDEFKKKYKEELRSKKEDIEKLQKIAKSEKLTLIYSAKNEEMNQAVVLKEFLETN